MKSNDVGTILAQDGTSNTRLKPITGLYCHCDYLRIRRNQIPMDTFVLLLEFLDQKLSCEMDKPWSPGGFAVYYENRIEGIEGIRGGFTVDDDGCVSVMIDLSGVYFKQLTPVDQWRLFRGLHYTYQMKCSRIDLAIDDYTYSVIPVDEMWEAANARCNFGFRKSKLVDSGNCGEERAVTMYYGSRESGKLVRTYDHDAECMRFEAEFKRAYSNDIFTRIATLERPDLFNNTGGDATNIKIFHTSDNSWSNTIQKTIASLAVGAIDFRHRRRSDGTTRGGFRDTTRCDFYQLLLDKIEVEPCRVRLHKQPRTIRKSLDWVKRQVAPTLATLAGGLGRHKFNLLIQEIVQEGELRMDKLKQLWELEIKEHPDIIPIK